MDTTTIVVIVIAALIILTIGGWMGVLFARYLRSKKLHRQFGPEYDRMVDKFGDKQEAEETLADRLKHVKSLDLQPLAPEQKERFANEWRQTQALFVDQPYKAVRQANQLVTEVMAAKGYPVDDSEQRIADLSVNYPELIANYRQVNEIVTKNKQDGLSTEEMRQVMIHCRAVFKEVLGSKTVENTEQKEKVE